MRLLMYLTPIVWAPSKLANYKLLKFLMQFNPIDYIVQGYRDCFFYHQGIASFGIQIVIFWVITFVLLVCGSYMMYKFKHKFIDLI